MARKYPVTNIFVTRRDTDLAEYHREQARPRFKMPPPQPEPEPEPAPQIPRRTRYPTRLRIENPATLAIDGVPTEPGYEARNGRQQPKRAVSRTERDRRAASARAERTTQNALEDFLRKDER